MEGGGGRRGGEGGVGGHEGLRGAADRGGTAVQHRAHLKVFFLLFHVSEEDRK